VLVLAFADEDMDRSWKVPGAAAGTRTGIAVAVELYSWVLDVDMASTVAVLQLDMVALLLDAGSSCFAVLWWCCC
jgi:hypothetical protein